jgi:UDP-glucuronate 4-epimerase
VKPAVSEAEAIVVTGAAGFIGHAVAERLLNRGARVIGVDDFNAYYDVGLKEARASRLATYGGFELVRLDIADAGAVSRLVRGSGARRIVHLAAQAGVRHDEPQAYARSNLVGHLAVLEACRSIESFEHLVYASSSSVYGERRGEAPFAETDLLEPPTSLYAATKQADELMSEAYARLHRLPQTALRFFTAYGPWGRPDMAYFAFARAILAGEPIELFDAGRLSRDFTYIDDIVDGIVAALDRPPDEPRHRVLNIGAGRPERVSTLVETLERLLGVKAKTVDRPKPVTEMSTTFADVSRLRALTGYTPRIGLEEGLARFVDWYLDRYGRG